MHAALFLAPAFLFLIAFGVAPMGYAIYMSLFDLRTGEAAFLGLNNYVEALHSAAFWKSFRVTLYFAVGTVPTTILLSFLIAKALYGIAVFRGLFRTLFFLPYITSIVAAAMIWRVLLEPTYGVATQLMGVLGLPAQTWLLEPRGMLHILTDGVIAPDVGPSLALCSIMLFEVWHSAGFMIVIFLAGLAAIPRELEEAASIDGAGWWHVTRTITIPMLSPTIFFLSVVGVIASFQAFSGLYALTGNGRGPLDTTQNMTVYIYSNLYEYGRLGYGAAVATLLCAAIAVLTLVQWRVAGRRVFYQ